MDIRGLFTRGGTDYVMLGDQKAEVRKLTYTKYATMRDVIDTIPGIVFSLTISNPDNWFTEVYAALDITIEEFYGLVAILAEIDVNYLKDNAGINEIIDYVVATIKKNDFAKTVKNVRSLLPEQTEKATKTEPATTQSENGY